MRPQGKPTKQEGQEARNGLTDQTRPFVFPEGVARGLTSPAPLAHPRGEKHLPTGPSTIRDIFTAYVSLNSGLIWSGENYSPANGSCPGPVEVGALFARPLTGRIGKKYDKGGTAKPYCRLISGCYGAGPVEGEAENRRFGAWGDFPLF
jgi:hypothetical protein